MSLAPISSRSLEQIDSVLKLLSDISADDPGDKPLQQLGQEACQIVTLMRRRLENSPLTLLATLVRANQEFEPAKLIRSIEALKNNFPETEWAETVQRVLPLVCTDDKHTTIGIMWARQLDAELRQVGFEALYDLTKSKGITNQLLVLKYVRKLSIGVQDEIRSELESNCRSIIDHLVKKIKQQDFTFKVIAFFVPTIVRNFDTTHVCSVQLLIEWSRNCLGDSDKVSFCIVNELLKSFEENYLLDSEQAKNLWLHIKDVKDNILSRYLTLLAPALDMCNKALDKLLTKMDIKVFPYYKDIIEEQDKKKLVDLHNQSPFWGSIAAEFVTWYYNGDSTRTHNLFVVATIFEGADYDEDILCEIYNQMVRLRHINTFEAFWLYNKFKRHYRNFLRFGHAKPPACVKLLLGSSEEKRLLLVNKCFNMPFCVQQRNVFWVVCCNSQVDEEQLCLVAVDSDTALATIAFKAGKLVAAYGGKVPTVAVIGTKWTIKAVDEHHVKISDKGKF